MIYRKGELSPASIDRGWPHQVALPASACEQGGYRAIHEFCKDLSICSRGHSVFHEDKWFNVYCFAKAADRRAHAMSFNEANAGAVAFSRSGDPNVGEFDDAVILKTFGQVPEDFTDSPPA